MAYAELPPRQDGGLTIEPLRCPTCGELPRGTVEQLGGVALLDGPDAAGRVHYTGDTHVWWEEQRTETDDLGRQRLICDVGHEWLAVVTEAP